MLKEWCRMSVIQLSYYGALTRQAVFFIFKKYTRVDVKKTPGIFRNSTFQWRSYGA